MDPRKKVLLITDSVLTSVEFHRKGFVFREKPRTITSTSIIIDDPDPFFPWLGQFIIPSLRANDGFPSAVTGLLNNRNIPYTDISKVFCIIGMKDEIYRTLYKTKTVDENNEDANILIEFFLKGASDNFPLAEIVWLGPGQLKTVSPKYQHLNGVVSYASRRQWPVSVRFENLFGELNDKDIKDHYGNLNTQGVRKIVKALEHCLREKTEVQ